MIKLRKTITLKKYYFSAYPCNLHGAAWQLSEIGFFIILGNA